MKHEITPALDFDPDIYFAIVADNLIARFGRTALDYADMAVSRMRRLGDDEGYSLWMGVHVQLCQRLRSSLVPTDATMH